MIYKTTFALALFTCALFAGEAVAQQKSPLTPVSSPGPVSSGPSQPNKPNDSDNEDEEKFWEDGETKVARCQLFANQQKQPKKEPLLPNVEGIVYFSETYPNPLQMVASVWDLPDQKFRALSINDKQVNKNCAAGGKNQTNRLAALPSIKNQFDANGEYNEYWTFESTDLTLFGPPYLAQRSIALYEYDGDLFQGKGSSKKDGNVGRIIACCNIEEFDAYWLQLEGVLSVEGMKGSQGTAMQKLMELTKLKGEKIEIN